MTHCVQPLQVILVFWMLYLLFCFQQKKQTARLIIKPLGTNLKNLQAGLSCKN